MRQQEVADRLGVSLSHYSKLEAGINQASDQLLAQFCREFGADLAWVRAALEIGREVKEGPGVYLPQGAERRVLGDEQVGAIVREVWEIMNSPERLEAVRSAAVALKLPESAMIKMLVLEKLKAEG